MTRDEMSVHCYRIVVKPSLKYHRQALVTFQLLGDANWILLQKTLLKSLKQGSPTCLKLRATILCTD